MPRRTNIEEEDLIKRGNVQFQKGSVASPHPPNYYFLLEKPVFEHSFQPAFRACALVSPAVTRWTWHAKASQISSGR